MPKPPKALTRLEERLRDGGYEVRYERGHFRAGYCVVHARRVVIVNKFFDAAARLATLREIAAGLDLPEAEASTEAVDAAARPAPDATPAS